MLLAAIPPDYLLTDPPTQRFGRYFGSVDFLKALLATGLFEQCHFFSDRPVDLERSRLALEPAPGAPPIELRSLPAAAMAEQARSTDYGLFFVPDVGADFSVASLIRAQTGARYPLLGIIHTLSYAAMEQDLIQLLLGPFRPFDVIGCSSTAGAQALLRLTGQVQFRLGTRRALQPRLLHVPLPVDTTSLHTMDRRKARVQVGLDPDTSYVLSFARFSVIDKFDYAPLLEAFRLALPRLEGVWKLVLAGGITDAAYYQELQRLAQESGLAGSVVFLPDVSDELRPSVYNAADLFVSPSDNFQETFGISPVEAMACGLPVIVSDWDGYKDTVQHGITGLRIPTYMPQLERMLQNRAGVVHSTLLLAGAQSVAVDVAGMAGAIVRLGNDPDLRASLGAHARRHAVERYDRQAVAACLRQALSGGGQSWLPAEVPQTDRLLTPWNLFESFPTGALGASDRLISTELSELVLTGRRSLEIFAPVSPYLCPDLPKAICGFCANGSSLSDVLAQFSDPERDSERLVYTVYWLLKQGMLAVDSPR